tara:strand:- start:3990 stop:4649 length:660 start_codon:yes stop_codon:yes gene_type:complete
LLAIFIGYSFFINDNKKLFDNHKTLLFLGIVIPILFATVYVTGGTIFINMISETKGPVHWHADFEVYNCGNKLDLIDPTGMSNRVGTRLFHEHGEDRIHVEGTVITYDRISLGNFFNVIGGKLTNSELVYPTNEGIDVANNGDLCNDNPGVLQVFLYSVEDGIFKQEKLDDFEHYVLSPYSYVPEGDCIIVEFDVEKDSTDKICETYRIAEEKGEIIGD